MPQVPGHEDARVARLEMKRIAIERPPQSLLLLHQIAAGENIIVIIEPQPVADGRRWRRGPDEHEQPLRGDRRMPDRSLDDNSPTLLTCPFIDGAFAGGH
jgi:hypothetical protein